MTEIDRIQQKASLCKRVCTDEFYELLEGEAEALGLNQPSVVLIKMGADPTCIDILSGMRDFLIHLKKLKGATEESLKRALEQKDMEEENE